MEGIITNIQRNSIHDGPGIRTTVFLKGCSLHCFWCHNPETIDPKPQVQFFSQKCIGCRRCVNICPFGAHRVLEGRLVFNRSLCRTCGKCTENCAAQALVLCGKIVGVPEVLKEVAKDRPFFEASEGGVTFSGGEPFFQKDFLKALLAGSKDLNLHTAVETAGNVPWMYFEEVLPYVDLFLYDIKLIGATEHRNATGTDNKNILKNIEALSACDKEIWVRVPIIPGVNDSIAEMEKIGDFLADKKGIKKVELLAFHQLAHYKYESLGYEDKTSGLNPPSAEWMQRLADVFAERGIDVWS